ncbi:hypothetical protein Y032_0037g3386 [Ancylostoma ceylanicum]|uniref:Uncharacterized protein n=1 Tax=Ancylostoma ceylanicum TaxID=53326 RepID=A0A016UJX4_9BILA|nr:hypothetical protein Y032_0037g3386 [Ancylostoma ceylanicum]
MIGSALVETRGYGSAMAKQWKTSGYGSALAKQRCKRHGTRLPWSRRAENARIRVHLGQAVVKTYGCGSADGGAKKAPENESTEVGWIHPDQQ